MHDYLSKDKSSNFHYFVLSIGTVRENPLTSSGRWRKTGASSLIQYTTLCLTKAGLAIGHMYDRSVIHINMTDRDVRA